MSSWLPPVTVSTFDTVSVLAPADDRISWSLPPPRLMVPEVCAAPSVTTSLCVPPVIVSAPVTVSVLAPADDRVSVVGAAAEVDRAGCQCGAQRDRVIARCRR